MVVVSSEGSCRGISQKGQGVGLYATLCAVGWSLHAGYLLEERYAYYRGPMCIMMYSEAQSGIRGERLPALALHTEQFDFGIAQTSLYGATIEGVGHDGIRGYSAAGAQKVGELGLPCGQAGFSSAAQPESGLLIIAYYPLPLLTPAPSLSRNSMQRAALPKQQDK